MVKTLLVATACVAGSFSFPELAPELVLTTSKTIDSLGACQGVSYQAGKFYLYGDREVGVIRTCTRHQDSLTHTGKEVKLTVDGQDVINHPTGIAYNQTAPTFIGNSTRSGDASLNPEGIKWRAVNWAGLLHSGTLDGNLLNTIEDDACVQGTRPQYVRYENKWYVATADYGGQTNEVRLYDLLRLAKAKKTSEPGVVVKKFTCSPWVQNLHWIPQKNVLVLIQNQREGRKWRFTFLDLPKSIETGREQIIRTVDVDKADELEGFTLLDDLNSGLAVTSSRASNAHFTRLSW